ncbi:MAG TPA: AarF/ABC1/UbiB kinase family protein [Myxococcales bacterium]|nr:AarF/ABC1/UbiB kinase family protein [Myxococcales bacterium]
MIQAVQDLKRLREISTVVVRHGFGELWDRAKIWDVLGRREDGERPSREEIRATSARRFRETLAELGPTFIKLGQILSSRPDILPPDFIAELSHLQDRAAPMPVSTVFQLIESGLGRPAGELFSFIDPEPMASASIAQVHRARLQTGEEVVVKVQRPGIEEQIRSDTDLLFYLARFLEGVIEETGIYTPTGIVTEFRSATLLELDFENEARNIEEFARNHADRPYVAIPKLYRDLSSRTVITLEELKGVKLKTVLESADSPGIDRKQLAHNLLEASFRQLFVDGLFHGDPHPGNVIVLEGNRIGLLDFGLVGRMSKQMQETIVLLVIAISLRDPDTVARQLYKVGIPDQRINLQEFRHEIHDILERYLGLKLAEVDSGVLMSELVDLAMKYRIKVPKEYAVLSKAAATTEGIIRQLDPELDVSQAALPYAKQLLVDRYNPASLSGGLLRLVLQLQGFLQDTPQQLSQILMDLEGGKFNVTVRNEDLARLNTSLKALGLLLFAGMISSGLIVGAFFLAGRSSPEGSGTTWPLPALLGLALAAMLFGAALTWTLVSGRLKKISVRRFLK